jgi:hypothetical protein
MKIVFPFLSSLTPPQRGGEMVWAELLFPLPVGERACPVKRKNKKLHNTIPN